MSGSFIAGRTCNQTASPDRSPNHNPGGDKHEILDDVLALQGRRNWDNREAQLWEQEERGDGAEHLKPQQQQCPAQKGTHKKADTDQRLPNGEYEHRRLRSEEAKGKRRHGGAGEGLGRAQAGEELKDTKP